MKAECLIIFDPKKKELRITTSGQITVIAPFTKSKEGYYIGKLNSAHQLKICKQLVTNISLTLLKENRENG